MGKNFFDELGDALVKTTKDIGKKANKVYEGQRLQNKIAGEKQTIQKLETEMGKRLYQQYTEGAVLGEELYQLCEKIDQHMKLVKQYESQAVGLSGGKICPSCHKTVSKDAAFCSYCGAPCPTPQPEPEEEAEDPTQPFCEDQDPEDTTAPLEQEEETAPEAQPTPEITTPEPPEEVPEEPQQL